MNLKIDSKIFDLFPDVTLGVATLHNIDNKGHDPEIEQLLRDGESAAIAKLGNIPVAQHPSIVPWREAYRKFGAKPKDYPSSIENLLRRILKGEQVRHINKLVDIYNIVSLKFLLPVGGEDLAKIQGEVLLTLASQNEQPVILLGENEARPPHPGEVIYKDDIGTICRRWNWKEADRTKLTEDTKNAVLVIEGILPEDKERVKQAISYLAKLLKKYCGGAIQTTQIP